MRELKFRTGQNGQASKPLSKKQTLPVPLPTGPACYFVRRCPWTGYFYAKGSRGSKSNGLWQRATVGMKWNYYMKRGLKTRVPSLDSLSKLPVVSGLLRQSKARDAVMPSAGPLALAAPLRESIRKDVAAGSSTRSGSSSKEGGLEVNAKKKGRTESDSGPKGGSPQSADAPQAVRPVTSSPSKRMSEEERDVMWFPGICVTKGFPDDFVVGVVPDMRTPRPDAPKSAPAESTVPTAPKQKTRKPRTKDDKRAGATARAQKTEAERSAEKKGKERKAPSAEGRRKARSDAGKKTANSKRADAAESAKAKSPPDAAMPVWRYRPEHQPTVSSAQKRVRQLKVAKADDPNQPR